MLFGNVAVCAYYVITVGVSIDGVVHNLTHCCRGLSSKDEMVQDYRSYQLIQNTPTNLPMTLLTLYAIVGVCFPMMLDFSISSILCIVSSLSLCIPNDAVCCVLCHHFLCTNC
jgi:hypothetical protein